LFAEGGVIRWDGAGTSGLIGGGVQIAPLDDRWSLSLQTNGAAGTPTFVTTTASVRWKVPLSPHWLAAGAATVGHATTGALPDVWDGAGTGQGRPLLLRAHPVLVDDRLAGPVFGRTVAQTTVEVQRDLSTRPLWSIGIAGFADAAQARRRADGSHSPLHVDVGIGLRVRLGPGGEILRVDVARGLRDGEMAVSVGWSPEI
jgi:hypothetical protein